MRRGRVVQRVVIRLRLLLLEGEHHDIYVMTIDTT